MSRSLHSNVVSSRIKFILQSIQELSGPIHVHGPTAGARALLLAQLTHDAPHPLVILCPDDDVGADLTSDIETLSETFLGIPQTVHHFPAWDQSLYSSIAPSLVTRFSRINTLSQLCNPLAPKIVVTTLAAACQATLPKTIFKNHIISIQPEFSIESREQLVRRLLHSGYLRVETVEDPGSFAVRGDLVDIFPPDRAKPLRIELFGDVIEKIREFDAASQRTTTEIKTALHVPPAREVLINEQTIPLLRSRLKAFADDRGVPRTARDPVLSSVQDGIYLDHSAAWAPFAYTETATLWDYLHPETMLVWCDELGCSQAWDSFLEEQNRLFQEAETMPANAPFVPRVEELFHWSPDVSRLLKDKSRLYLDQVELADLNTVEKEPLDEKGEQQVSERHRSIVLSNSDLTTSSRHSLGDLEKKFHLWRKQGFKVLVLAPTSSQLERLRFLFDEHRLPSRTGGIPDPSTLTLSIGTLTEGFRWPAEGAVVILENEILGSKHVRTQRKNRKENGSAAKDWAGLQALSDLTLDDAVVHVDHGIGRYRGLVRLDLSGAPSDFLLLEYANKDKLYLPIYRLNVIQKYVGAGQGAVLDRLGSQHFTKAKEQVRSAVRKLAIDLIHLYAERKIRPGIRFSPRDGSFREFEAKFPYDETPDQLKAIDNTLADLESGRVMDRLVCGDVGYGKTEVAIRTAFRAVSDGKQVAVLVPTTILAQQHEETFRSRLKDYPLIIESLSRFKTQKQQKEIIAALTGGKVDIIIGTHRLLSRDIKFHDLGLIIVDEEHRFGVEHKERLKTLKSNTHVLTLTATPIPRTLHMALSGLRDISLINTAPVDRLPIRTYVSKFDDSIIKRAIEFELSRGGQVFFLHNRTQSIQEMATRIRTLVPQAIVVVGHGQMTEAELEKTMLAFYHKEANVLVCTTIIESGLDLPSANTILINRADTFGLAQLYQIRGRVGRGQQRAYAYLLLPAETTITDDAKRRIEVIQRFVELGSGFSIASHDLEIRGGGDLLGPQQSGNIEAVGFDLYTELLEEAIREIQGKPLPPEDSRREPEIKVPFPAFLADSYVSDVHQRLSLYRRFSAAANDTELNSLEQELLDRFGPLPVETQNLFWLIRIKQLLKKIGVDSLTAGAERVSLVSGPGSQLDPVRAIALVSAHPQSYQLMPDSKFVAHLPTGSLRDLYFGLEKLMRDLGVQT